MNPGVIPPDLDAMTVSGCATSGGPTVAAPRTISSTVMGRAPIRFVNQLESGTSPRVLTFTAGGMSPSGRCLNVFSMTSNAVERSTSAGLAMGSVSGSTRSGSSGRNRGAGAASAEAASGEDRGEDGARDLQKDGLKRKR